jgi:hypothetical protein
MGIASRQPPARKMQMGFAKKKSLSPRKFAGCVDRNSHATRHNLP